MKDFKNEEKVTLGEFLYSDRLNATNNGKTYEKETVKRVLNELITILIVEWEVEDSEKMRSEIKDSLLVTPLSDFLDKCRQRKILQTFWSVEEKSYYKLTLPDNKKIKNTIGNLRQQGTIV